MVIALGVGFITYKGFRQTADKQIEATSNIVFKVYMRGVTISGSEIPIKKGEKLLLVSEMFLIQIWILLMLRQTEEKLFYLL